MRNDKTGNRSGRGTTEEITVMGSALVEKVKELTGHYGLITCTSFMSQ
jgi:hypothetical protein